MARSSDGAELEETLPAEDGVDAYVEKGRLEDLARGSVIGRYVVIAQVGAGAMGVVFAAYDPQLDRKVALKVLRPRGGNLGLARERLQREAQALAKLGHPNVVTVYDVGVHDEQIFVAMEFVEGQTIRAWMESAPVVSTGSGAVRPSRGEVRAGVRPWREVLGVFAQAGRGLAAAHEAGLIHRDFKPDNVMLSEDGRVRVMDFGLARADEPTVAATQPSTKVDVLTQTGAALGTPAYMPLEQFGGGPVDARSDQFSFCVALHEALYGERPFVGETLGELMGVLLRGEVRVVTARGAGVPHWVRVAVLRGLATNPEDRFASMQALLDALAADPVARRRRVVLRLGLGLGLVAGAWAVATLSGEVEQRDAVIEEQASELELKNADLERRLAEQELLLSVQRGLRASMLVGTENEAEALLMGVQAVGAYAHAWAHAPREAVRGLEEVLAHEPVIVRASHVLEGHEDALTFVAYAPDGTWLATSSLDGSVRIWDPVRARLLTTLGGHGGHVYHLAPSPDGTRIVTTSADAKARIWDVDSGELLATLVGHEAPLHMSAFSPDGARLATAELGSGVRVWDVQTGEPLLTLLGGGARTVLAYAPDGTRLVTAGTDAKARVWDARTGKRLVTLVGHEGPILAVAVAPDGTEVVTAGTDQRARLWALETGELVAILEGHESRISELAYAPDGTRLATVSWDTKGLIHDAATGALVTTLAGGHHNGIASLAYAPDGSSVATGSFEGRVSVWDPETGKLEAALQGHKADVWGLAFAPDGRQLASASVDRSIRLWDVDQTRVEVLEGPEANVRLFAYAPDHLRLATVSMDGRLRLWSSETHALLHSLDEGAEVDGGVPYSVGFSPDGAALMAKHQGWLRSWDTRTGALRASTRLSDRERRTFARYSPAGTLLVLGDESHVSTYDARTLEPLATMDERHFLRALSPDDARFAIEVDASTVQLLDPRTGALMAEIEAPEDTIHGVEFSPDGTELAIQSERAGVRLWDARRLTVRATLPDSVGRGDLLYDPRGARLALVGAGVGVRVWDVKAGEVVTHIEPEDRETGRAMLVFSQDGSRFAVRGTSFVRVHDTATGELIVYIDRSFRSPIVLSPDGSRVTGVGSDHTFEVWDIATGKPLLRERVGVVQEDGSIVAPIPPRELTRIGCARLRVFERSYAEVRELCERLLGDRE